MFRKFIIVSSIIAAIAGGGLTSAMVPIDYGSLSYVFHLYYDNGTIVVDRDAKYAYDVVFDEYIPAQDIPANKRYKGNIVSNHDLAVASFVFDPQAGNSNFQSGKISVKGPYYPEAAKIEFFNPVGAKILTISVTETSDCNQNDVCEEANGETNLSCPSDCKAVELSKAPTPSVEPEAPTEGSGILRPLLYMLAGLGIMAYFLWRKWGGRGKGGPPEAIPTAEPAPTATPAPIQPVSIEPRSQEPPSPPA